MTSNQRYVIAGAILVAAVIFGVRDVPLAAFALYLVGAAWCAVCAVLDRGRLWGRLLLIWLPVAPLLVGTVAPARFSGDTEGGNVLILILSVVCLVCLLASGLAFLAAAKGPEEP